MTVRVLHVIDGLTGGGAEESLRLIIRHTKGSEVQHAVVLLRADLDGLRYLTDVGVPSFVPVQQVDRMDGVRHVLRAIRAMRPDLVHTTLFEAGLAGRLAARIAGVPAVESLVNVPLEQGFAVHDGVAGWKRQAVSHIERVLARFATKHFHAVTDEIAHQYSTARGIKMDRIVVIPRGRDRDALGWCSRERRSTTRIQLGMAPDEPILLAVGREEPQKNHTTLLYALSLLRREFPRARLVIAGRRGRASKDVDRKVEELELCESVLRLGHRTDVADLLCAADVFVTASRYEGAAGATIEAMAMGTPIVASDIPPHRELLEAGRLGALCPVDYSPEFAIRVAQVLRGDLSRAGVSNEAQETFNAKYSMEASGSKFIDFWASSSRREHRGL